MTRTMVTNKITVVFACIGLALFGLGQMALGGNLSAVGNISPVDKWAWSTNAGWINFSPVCNGCEGVTVYADHLEGYAWGENVGWIRLGAHTGGGKHTYGNSSPTDYGVNLTKSGSLSGYAWGTNVGWINFDPEHGGVTIDPASGSLDGYAWAENVGWIHFKGPGYNVVGPITQYKVYLPLVLRHGP